jgi:transcriptional regulator with XRE-family HTH domain
MVCHMDSSTTATSAVAAKVRATMTAKGVSQVSLAEATGIPRVTLIRRLNGHASFTIEELAAIATHLGVDVASLLEAAA